MGRRFLFAILLIALGCAKDHGPESGGLAENFKFPEKISLKLDNVRKVSNGELVSTKTFLKRLRRVNQLRDHVLISDNETSKSKERRTREFARLPDRQKSAINDILSRCRLTDRPLSGAFGPLSGTEAHLDELLRTSGANCPADLLRHVHTHWKILSTDDSGESGTAEVQVHAKMHSLYKEQPLIRAAMVRVMNLEFFVNGRMEIDAKHSRTYAHLEGVGSAELVMRGTGPAQLRMRGEYLERDDSDREIALYADVTVNGGTFPLAILAKKEDGEYHVEQFYIGQTALTPQERSEIGVDDFLRRLSE